MEGKTLSPQTEAVTKHVVACGSYEGSFVGWTYEIASQKLLSKFSVSDHAQHITSVSACPKWMVTGSADENIRIYNSKKFVSVGSLVQHVDTVTCLRFSKNHQYLVSGSHNGTIVVYRTKNWQTITLKGQKKAVNDACLHSSKPLVISVGMDACVITWNHQSGRTVDTMKFQAIPKGCCYSPQCGTFAVMFDKLLCVFSAVERNEDALVKYTSESTIHCLCYISESLIAIGTESKSIRIISSTDGSVIAESSDQHLSRVRGITSLPLSKGTTTSTTSSNHLRSSVNSSDVSCKYVIYSCDTSGRLCIWSLDNNNTCGANTSASQQRQDMTTTPPANPSEINPKSNNNNKKKKKRLNTSAAMAVTAAAAPESQVLSPLSEIQSKKSPSPLVSTEGRLSHSHGSPKEQQVQQQQQQELKFILSRDTELRFTCIDAYPYLSSSQMPAQKAKRAAAGLGELDSDNEEE